MVARAPEEERALGGDRCFLIDSLRSVCFYLKFLRAVLGLPCWWPPEGVPARPDHGAASVGRRGGAGCVDVEAAGREHKPT